MDKTGVIVLGAGISGLFLSLRLLELGFSVTILEKEEIPGGLAATICKDGYCADCGPHSFFSDDKALEETVLSWFTPCPAPLPRDVALQYKNRFIPYPLTLAGITKGLGLWEGMASLCSYLFPGKSFVLSRKMTATEPSIKDWAVARYGPRIWEHFFRPYTEGFWKVSGEALCASTIPSSHSMGIRDTLISMLFPGRKPRTQADREKLPSYYPEKGFGEIAGTAAEKVAAMGGDLRLGCIAEKVWGKPGNACVRYRSPEGEKTMEAKMLVSTIPLDILCGMLSLPAEIQVSLRHLAFRPLLVLALGVPDSVSLEKMYVYFSGGPYNRITDMNRFSGETSPEGKNLLLVEIPVKSTREHLWKASWKELLALCKDSLKKDGILNPEEVDTGFCIRKSHAYPVMRPKTDFHLGVIKNYIHALGYIRLLGRSGEYLYMDADLCMKRAFDLAKCLAQGAATFTLKPPFYGQ